MYSMPFSKRHFKKDINTNAKKTTISIRRVATL